MDYEYYAVRWLSDYRNSLFLKGKWLFHTKNTRLFDDDSQENATTITLRLSADYSILYDILDFQKLVIWRLYDYSTTILLKKTTTIGYDYSRSCHDYSSRNAATIADLYLLSGESPKRAAAVAANGFAPPACCWTAPPGGGCQTDPVRSDCWPMPDRKPPGVGSIETPPGWHSLRYAAPSGMDP